MCFIPCFFVARKGREFRILVKHGEAVYTVAVSVKTSRSKEVRACGLLKELLGPRHKEEIEEAIRQSNTEEDLALNVSFIIKRAADSEARRKNILYQLTPEIYRKTLGISPTLCEVDIAFDKKRLADGIGLEDGREINPPTLNVKMKKSSYFFSASLPKPLSGSAETLEEAIAVFEAEVEKHILFWRFIYEIEHCKDDEWEMDGCFRDLTNVLWGKKEFVLLFRKEIRTEMFFTGETGELRYNTKDKSSLCFSVAEGSSQSFLDGIRRAALESELECSICYDSILEGFVGCKTGTCPGRYHGDCLLEWRRTALLGRGLCRCLLCGSELPWDGRVGDSEEIYFKDTMLTLGNKAQARR
ncbi:MAG: uncharacterized protein A8A55_0554 [Amphiamblys sp. WSBS2006]|nr:MAG: uncharacterized protein A8A55_0554 [Amphiamblys sp. WSBS2006]